MHGLAFLLSGVLSSSSGFRSLLEAFQVSGKLFSQGSADHGFSSRLRARTPTPPPYTPAPLAPFSSFLAFSFAVFFLSGLLGGHPGSFSQRTPVPPPPHPRGKRERADYGSVCVCVCVCQHLYPRILYTVHAGGHGVRSGTMSNEAT